MLCKLWWEKFLNRKCESTLLAVGFSVFILGTKYFPESCRQSDWNPWNDWFRKTLLFAMEFWTGKFMELFIIIEEGCANSWFGLLIWIIGDIIEIGCKTHTCKIKPTQKKRKQNKTYSYLRTLPYLVHFAYHEMVNFHRIVYLDRREGLLHFHLLEQPLSHLYLPKRTGLVLEQYKYNYIQ